MMLNLRKRRQPSQQQKSETKVRLPWGMCLNEAHGQARLNDIIRQKNMCSDASNGDSSGMHNDFFLETEKGKERHHEAESKRQE